MAQPALLAGRVTGGSDGHQNGAPVWQIVLVALATLLVFAGLLVVLG